MIYERTTRRVMVHAVEPSRLLVSTTHTPEHRFWTYRVPSAEVGDVEAECLASVGGRWGRADRESPPSFVEIDSLRVCLRGTVEQLKAEFKAWFDAQGFDPDEIENGVRR